MKKSFFLSVLVVVFALVVSSCGGSKDPEPEKSSENKILTVSGNIGTWQVNESAKEITGVVPKAENLIGVTLTFTVSPHATASPASPATNLDFSANKEVTITVTAQDGTPQAYKAKATATAN